MGKWNQSHFLRCYFRLTVDLEIQKRILCIPLSEKTSYQSGSFKVLYAFIFSWVLSCLNDTPHKEYLSLLGFHFSLLTFQALLFSFTRTAAQETEAPALQYTAPFALHRTM